MIRIKNLNIRLGIFTLQDINLDIYERDYFVLLGPTGAGKSVLAEYVIGIIKAQSGEIRIDNRRVDYLKPEDRNIGYLPQDYVLFRHLSVKGNIGYGLWLRKRPKSEIETRVEEIAGQMDISSILNRSVHNLSGGEKQRCALARALVISPSILVLDEPLSAVDEMTGIQLQKQLKMLHQTANITIFHICHNIEEALSLGTRIGILSQGRLLQVGSASEIIKKPINRWVAQFMGNENIFTGTCKPNSKYTDLVVDDLKISVDDKCEGKVDFCIRPEEIEIFNNKDIKTELDNIFYATVTDIRELRYNFFISLKVGRTYFQSVVSHEKFKRLQLKRGEIVSFGFNRSSVHLMPEQSTQ